MKKIKELIFPAIFIFFLLISLMIQSQLFIWISIFLISLYFLIKSSDHFTSNSEKLGISLGISPFIVGVTILALGTSLPELLTSLFSVYKGTSEFVAGNVLGSNIANILLVLGVSVIFAKKKLKIEFDIIQVDLPLLLSSAFILFITFIDGKFTFVEGIICFLGYIIYLAYSINVRKEHKNKRKEKILLRYPIIILVSSIVLYFSARYTIESVISLTKIFGFGDTTIIALSAVAIGTSLPELMVSVSAAKRQNYEMAVGNVLGSNIFNSFIVMGIPSLISTLTISKITLNLALPAMIIATLMFMISIQDKEISKYEGLTFILIYLLFIGKLFGLL